MQKRRQILTPLGTLMKVSFFQFVLSIILIGYTYAHPVKAQEILSQKIDLTVNQKEIKTVLSQLESIAHVKFVYSPRSLPVQRRVTLSLNNKTLSEVLDLLFQPEQISYRVVNGRIILKMNIPTSSLPEPATLPDSKPADITVQGKVTDEKNETVPGVNIVLKGTTRGAITDVDGSYKLNLPEGSNHILVFSLVGYTTQEIVIGSRVTIDIQLVPEDNLLSEVVVVGYGTQKKSDLTGSVVRANIDAFRESPNVNIAQSLQGTVPGLNIGQVSTAGQNPTISIRGRTTINGNQNVLLVVDGIIYTGNLSDLNPADIESVDVLKDPSSMAIYGAQAANGVILITTKGGKKNAKPVFNYSGSYTTQNPVNSLTLFDRDGYIAKLANQDWKNAFLAPDYTTPNPNYNIQNFISDPPIREGYNNGTSYDWWGNTTSPGFITAHNLSVTGSSQDWSYFISGGYTDQKGFIMNDKFKRITTRINVENTILKWLKIGAQTFGSFSDYSGISPSLGGITIMSPLVKPTDENGNYVLNPMGTNVSNPFLVALADDFDKRNNLFGNFYANIDVPFVKGLSYRINYGHNYSWDRHYSSNPYSNSMAGEAYKINSNSYDWTFDNIVNFKKSIKDVHSIDATLVAGRRYRKFEESNATGTNFNSLRLSYNDLSQATIQRITSSAWQESYLYYMGRINYEYKYKYILTATLRQDGFSGFAENKKTALFPSIGFGWVLSQEDFLKVNAINLLKLRGSYGTNGNLVNRYSSLARTNIYPAYVFGDGSATAFGQQITTLANPNLSWETTTGFNFGLDFALLKNRISGSVDYYRTTTNNLIFNVNIPVVTGFNQIISNVGNIANRGVEFVINAKPITGKNLSWMTNFNLAANRNRIVSLLGQDNDQNGIEDDLVANGLFIGKSIGAIYDYESGGIIQLGEEAPKGYFVGTHRIVDQNGDGFTDANDRVIRGRSEAAYNFGILNEFSHRNFTLRIFINSIQGGKNGYRSLNMPSSLGVGDNIRRNNFWQEFDYWTPSNPGARYRALDQGAAIEYNYYGDRSFVRLQDITLSYALGQTLAKKMGMQGVKVFISGKNLATWTKWQGWDPETGDGLLVNGRPVMTGFSAGLDVRF